MHQPHPLIFCLLLLSALLFAACEKLNLPPADDTPAEKSAEGQATGNEDAGTEAYTVAEAIANQHFGEAVDIQVTGYIVGYVQRSSIKSSTFAAGSVRTNILLADTPVETDSTRCIPVQLTTVNLACKATRAALNLCDNPDMLHQKVRLWGTPDLYMGVPGLLKAHDHTLLPDDFDYAAHEAGQKADEPAPAEGQEDTTTNEPTPVEGQDGTPTDTDEPTTPSPGTEEGEEGEQAEDTTQPEPNKDENPVLAEAREWFASHGTKDSPLSINDIKTTVAAYYPTIDLAGYRIADIYVSGYIVGYYTTGNKVVHFSTNANKDYATNIVLADSPDELKKANCIVVELPSGSTIRDELNLFSNKKNLGRRITIFGNIEKYGIDLGIKDPRNYTFE